MAAAPAAPCCLAWIGGGSFVGPVPTPPLPSPKSPLPGSTDTSLWTHYKNGARSYCGNDFPDGMRKNQRLERNVITPTTKVEGAGVAAGLGWPHRRGWP
jgi:hypothetical protein